MDRICLTQDRLVTGSCGHSKELSISLNNRDFFELLSDCQLYYNDLLESFYIRSIGNIVILKNDSAPCC